MEPAVQSRPSWRWWLVVGAALVVINLVIYSRVVRYDFVQLDDPTYVSENVQVAAGLTWESIRWAFTTLHAGYWIPLTWLSYMAEVQIFGLNAGALHAGNLLLHILNTLFLLWLLVRLTGATWPSALVAALFAAHPLHVESVAWVTERKDVLSTLFGLAAIALYVKWAGAVGADPRVGPNDLKAKSPFDSGRRQEPLRASGERKAQSPRAESRKPNAARTPRAESRKPARGAWLYAATVAAFLASLMAKPMLVTLPLVLLVLDYWPLGRTKSEVELAVSTPSVGHRTSDIGHRTAGLRRLWALVREKLPLLAIALVIGVATAVAQHPASLQVVPFVARLQNAAVASVSYLGKMFWPAHLSPLYLLPPTLMQTQWQWLGKVSDVPTWHVVGALVTLVVVSVLAIVGARRRPFLFVGWLWYVCTLLPVSGLFQSGPQLMADRFTYVPLIGIAVIVAWGLADVVAAVPKARVVVAGVSVVAVVACTAAARAQVPVWENSVTFWTRATQDTLHVDAFEAHLMLGEILHKQGRLDEAREHFSEAIRLRPGSAGAHHGLGRLLADQGVHADAIAEFQKAVALDGRSAEAQNDLGAALVQTGRIAEAKTHLAEAVRLNPALAEARRNLGAVLAANEQWSEAIPHLAEAVRLKPGLEAARQDLGIALAETHRFAEAIREFDETLRLNPHNEIARRARDELSAKMSGR